MQPFQYQYGDKPLEAFTIQRAAGRGGFGEVYYAISDSGREVALKTVQNYHNIELRGISQCMNLKNPHLVSIFDIKYNHEGKPFVIMEFVSGPSLHDLIQESPGGLGTQKTAYFLREIAKGLSYLHESGIVHRDLKPGNIFYENGYVKIGDYGLSKMMTASCHSGQTITVGTVHYMAPEIGAGCYDKSIDIYALGILLYEMLTGQVPFFGSTPSEILMKHMTAEPDLTNIEEPFARVIRKALAKDPANRYHTVQEMVEDVFGAEHIRDSVSHFSTESLSIVAEKVAQKVQQQNAQQATAQKTPPPRPYQKQENISRRLKYVGERIDQLGEDLANSELIGQPIRDFINSRQRLTLSMLTIIIVAIGTGLFSGNSLDRSLLIAIQTFLMIVGASRGILFARWRWMNKLEKESRWLQNAIVGAVASFLCVILSLFMFGIMDSVDHGIRGTWLAIAIVLCITNWTRLTTINREQRISLSSAIWAGFLGFIAAEIFDGLDYLVIGVLAGTSLAVQAASSFTKGKRITPPNQKLYHRHNNVNHSPRTHTTHSPHLLYPKQSHPQNNLRQVPPIIRMLWLLIFIITSGLGIFSFLMIGMKNMGPQDESGFIAFGVGCLLFCVFCLKKVFSKVFISWYRYLIKPLLLYIFLQITITVSIILGNANLHGDDEAIAIFFIIFSSMTFLVISFIPSRIFERSTIRNPVSPTLRATHMVSPHKRIWALILSGLIFIGAAGLHRFYVGKIGTGILWLCTFGLFGIGQFIDIILILSGNFKDCYGFPLVMWESEEELKRSKDTPPIYKPIPLENESVTTVPPPNRYEESDNSMESEEHAPSRAEQASSPDIAVASRSSVVLSEPFQPFSFLCGSIAMVLLLLALLITVATVLHVPFMIAGGIFSNEIVNDLNQFFGNNHWPPLVMRISLWISIALLVLATPIMILARRNKGAIHIIRTVLGFSGLVIAIAIIFESLFTITSGSYKKDMLPQIYNHLEQHLIGPAFETLFNNMIQEEPLIIAGFILTASITLLAWPAKRNLQTLPTPPATPEPQEGES